MGRRRCRGRRSGSRRDVRRRDGARGHRDRNRRGARSTNTTFPSTDPPNGILAPWWEDLTIDPSISGGFAFLGWGVVGAAPNRQWIIEWRDARISDHTRTSHRRFTFQLVLFETSHVIEYRYGETATVGDPATPASASVGLEDETGLLGQDVLGCTPICRGPPRPGAPMGFPRQTVIRMTPR